MINWNQLHVSIDNQAQSQLEHYFQDIAKILDSQNLSFKKDEVFLDLENHIIDYVANKKLQEITFSESLQIISELGPPDEYTDFSTMPGLMDEIKEQENPKTKVIDSSPKFSSNFILCPNCNSKNEETSSFCINCGIKLQPKPESLQSVLTFFNKIILQSIVILFLIILGLSFLIGGASIGPMEIAFAISLIFLVAIISLPIYIYIMSHNNHI